MTNTYAPQIPAPQIVDAIWYFIGETWAPGIVFPSGPDHPADSTAHNNDFFFQLNIPSSTLHRHEGDGTSGQWYDLGSAGANIVTLHGTSIPSDSIGSNLQFYNRYSTHDIYQKINGSWHLVGVDNGGLPLSADAITFTDIATSLSARLGLILVDGNSPILGVDSGLVVKKDITAGGYLGTNQGEVWIGHGRDELTDLPKIILMHANSQSYGTDANGNPYDTLYIRKAIGESTADEGNLDIGNLTAHGKLRIFPSSNPSPQDGDIWIV